MKRTYTMISLEHSLDAMLQDNEGKIDNCDERLVAFIRDKHRSRKLEKWNSQDESGNTLLHNAARCDVVSVSQYLIETKSNVNIQNNLGQTPLMIATKNLSKKMIEALLLAKADPNIMDCRHRSSLHYLYHYNRTHSEDHLKILKMFIQYGASLILTVDNLNYSQIDLVLRYGNREALQIMMEANLDLSGKHENRNTPVHLLAKNQNNEVFKALDDCIFDANVCNAKLQTPLYCAIYNGNVHAVQYLLDRDANFNATNGSSGSALYNAVYNFATSCGEKYQTCIELLLAQSPDIQLHSDILRYVPQMFKKVEDKLTYNTGKIMIAYLVVREALGTRIADEIRNIINSKSVSKNYYEFCRQQLSTVIYNSVTLFDLLSANQLKFEQHAHNQVWNLNIQEFFEENTSDLHGFHAILKRRMNRATQMIKLKMSSASILCSIMKLEYAIFHLAANRIVSFLSKQDLHFLSRVTL